MHVMPEFAVPYAFHLLAHRKETPTFLPDESNEDRKVGRTVNGRGKAAASVSNDDGEKQRDSNATHTEEHSEEGDDALSGEQVQVSCKKMMLCSC